MSAAIQVIGHIDSHGHVEITQSVNLPPGEVLITIETVTDHVAIDDALWDEQFQRSPHVLAAISAEIQAAIAAGTVEDLHIRYCRV